MLSGLIFPVVTQRYKSVCFQVWLIIDGIQKILSPWPVPQSWAFHHLQHERAMVRTLLHRAEHLISEKEPKSGRCCRLKGPLGHKWMITITLWLLTRTETASIKWTISSREKEIKGFFFFFSFYRYREVPHPACQAVLIRKIIISDRLWKQLITTHI